MSAILLSSEPTTLELRHEIRVKKLINLVDKLKKVRALYIHASNKIEDAAKRNLFFAIAKERIVFIIQLQNEINKYNKKVLENAFLGNNSKEEQEIKPLEVVTNTTTEAIVLGDCIKKDEELVANFRAIISSLSLSSKLEMLICKQLVSIENSIDLLKD